MAKFSLRYEKWNVFKKIEQRYAFIKHKTVKRVSGSRACFLTADSAVRMFSKDQPTFWPKRISH